MENGLRWCSDGFTRIPNSGPMLEDHWIYLAVQDMDVSFLRTVAHKGCSSDSNWDSSGCTLNRGTLLG